MTRVIKDEDAANGRGRMIVPALAAAALATGVLLRICPVIVWPSLDWGDEVYQTLEPAHRLVFGTGLVTWEFVAGIRSWILPGAISAVFAAARALGAGPGFYLPAVALGAALLSLVPVVFTFVWCRRAFGVWPALAGAAVVLLAPEMVYFGARTLAEVVAAHVLVGAVFLLNGRKEEKLFFFEKKNQKTFVPLADTPAQRTRHEEKVFCFFFSKKKAFLPFFAGALLGLAVALRPQIAPAALVIFAWPGTRLRWLVAGGGAVMLTAAALLDWVTLGAPGASIWRYALVNLHGASAHFGVQPWYYFGLAEAAIWGAALPVPIALCLWGARRWALPLVAALAVIGLHMAIGHKEHRFIYPALVLCAVQAGIGLADISARLVRRLPGGTLTAFGVCVGGWIILSGLVWVGPGMAALRHRAADTLAAADYAATLPGICGIGMGPGHDAWVPYGGYTHLHQPVPLYWPADQAAFRREAAGFNLLLSETREPGYATLRCFGAVCVAKRVGNCRDVTLDAMPARP